MTEIRKHNLVLSDLTDRIIGAAIEVHKILGPGFLESIYQKALEIEMKNQGLTAEAEKEIEVYFKKTRVGLHRLDLLVENQIIVELKAVKEFDESNMAQVLSYLKATGCKVGLLFNFAKATLKIKRIVN
ncbi:MAG: GxxExxY protein [Candidatus Edwardsbacteria bacterium]|nr:GxxExxY protein [Candidatus Edwardsbacteria bacterium]